MSCRYFVIIYLDLARRGGPAMIQNQQRSSLITVRKRATQSFINVPLLVLLLPPLQRFKRTILPAMDTEMLTESVDRHPLVSLVAACFWVIRAFSDAQYHLIVNRDVDILVWLLSWAKSLVAFATITLPRFIYAVLSYSMTLTVRRLLLSLVDHSS